MSHLPYRNGCPHCGKGRGKARDHQKQKQDESGNPECHIDYCFPGSAEGNKLTVLAIVERQAKVKKAVAVPTKRTTGRYAARMVLDLIGECGDKEQAIMVKSD